MLAIQRYRFLVGIKIPFSDWPPFETLTQAEQELLPALVSHFPDTPE